MTGTQKQTVVAFDLYGTLLSTESIAKQLEPLCGAENAQSITVLWRRYQLEYTWRLNSCFESFADITQNSLRHALAEYRVEISEDNLRSLMTAYDSLSAFPDVKPTLEQLASTPDITAVVFSNGTEAMASNSVHRSADLSPNAKVFDDIVTVDSVAEYKPTPAAYGHLAKRVGKSPSQMNELWLISGNPFDIIGAKNMGMNAIWIDRKGGGWVDACLPHLHPTAVVNNLEQIVEVLLNSHGH